MPFDVRVAQMFLIVRHLSLRPDILPDHLAAGGVVREAFHQADLRSRFRNETHLIHELDCPSEAEGTVRPVREEMHFRRYVHPSELPVDQGRSIRGVDVITTVEKAHRAGLSVELEDGAELHVRTVALAGRRGSEFAVRG